MAKVKYPLHERPLGVTSRGGRPSSYTPERHAAIIRTISNGGTRRDAERAASIGSGRLTTWLKDPRPAFQPLRDAVAEAEKEAVWFRIVARMRPKRCPRCRTTKHREHFYHRTAWCKVCSLEDARTNHQRRRARAAADPEYREREQERVRRNSQAWFDRDPEGARRKRREANKQWQRENPEAHKAERARHAAARRARKRGATASERIDRDYIWTRDNGTCHLCGKRADPTNWHLDHIIPLAHPETRHTRDNVRVSHPECNTRKGAKAVGEQLLLVG